MGLSLSGYISWLKSHLKGQRVCSIQSFTHAELKANLRDDPKLSQDFYDRFLIQKILVLSFQLNLSLCWPFHKWDLSANDSLPRISVVTSWNLFYLSLRWPPEICCTYLCGDLLKYIALISAVTSWNLFHLSLWWPPEISSTFLRGALLKSLLLISAVTS